MVHFMRNALSLVPKAAQQMVGATIRTVFASPMRLAPTSNGAKWPMALGIASRGSPS
jgi:transposase-like protein